MKNKLSGKIRIIVKIIFTYTYILGWQVQQKI